jgi:hypothetical protein
MKDALDSLFSNYYKIPKMVKKFTQHFRKTRWIKIGFFDSASAT